MKKIGMAALCAAAILTGCNYNITRNVVYCKGDVVQKELDLTGFDRIQINGSADLNYLQDQSEKVSVKANEDVFQYLNFRVEDGVLILETVDSVQIRAETFDVYVNAPVMKTITVNGAADAKLAQIDSDENLSITVNGAGDIELKNVRVPELDFTVNGAGDLDASGLKVGKLSLSVNGAGDADLSGEADSAVFRISGAGDVDARGLACKDIQLHKSGAARIRTQ